MAREHEQSGARVTLAVTPNRAPERYGGVCITEDGAVTGFVPRGSAETSWHFIGVQVVDARVFADLAADEPAESVNGVYPALLREQPGSIRAVRCSAAFADIGTPTDYYETSMALGAAEGKSTAVGRGCVVDPSARVTASILWDEVIVGPDAMVHACVLADGVCVPAGAHLNRQVVVRADACRPGPADEVVGALLVSPLPPR